MGNQTTQFSDYNSSNYTTIDQPMKGSKWGVLRDHSWGSNGNVVIDGLPTTYHTVGQLMEMGVTPDVQHEQGSLRISLDDALKIADLNYSVDAVEYDHTIGIAVFKTCVSNVCPSLLYEKELKGRFTIHFKIQRFDGGNFFKQECSGFNL